MKWNVKDPTANDYDQNPLSPGELKKVKRTFLIWAIILIIISQIIISLL
jgi:hypothetical protein